MVLSTARDNRRHWPPPLIAMLALLVDAGLFATGSSVVSGEQPREVVAAPVDLYGDPLPQGAVARLGTVRDRHAGWIHAIVFTRDGKTLITAGEESLISFWDLVAGKRRDQVFSEYEARALALSGDGANLASADLNGNVKLRKTTTGELLWSASGSRWFATSVALSANAKNLALGGRDGTIRIWEVGTDREPRGHTTGGGGDAYVAFPRDGHTLVAACSDGSIRTWDIATGRQQTRWQYFPEISGFALAPDARTVALAARESGGTHLKQVDTGKEVRAFPIHASCLAFSPDGTILGTGGGGVLCLWEVRTGKQIYQWTGLTGLQALAFSPDGKTIAACGE